MKTIYNTLAIVLTVLLITRSSAQTTYSLLEFDGVNDLVDCGIPGYPNLSSTDEFTFEVWVNPDGNHWGRIWTYWPQSGDLNFAIQLSLLSSNKIAFNAGQYTGSVNPPSAQVISNNSVSINNWHHIAAIYTNGLLELYIDGIFEGSANYIGPYCPTGANSKLWFGIHPMEPVERFSGRFEEMRVSNFARYTSPFSPPCPDYPLDSNTIGLWHFNEGAGTVAGDSSSLGNHGTITGATWVLDTICMPPPLICDTTLVDQFTMTVNSAFTHNFNSSVGEKYLIKINGTYCITTTLSCKDGAFYYQVGGNPVNPPTAGGGWTLNGSAHPLPTPNSYAPSHNYNMYYTATSTSMTFGFVDGGGYGDNSGSLNFKVYLIPPPTPTVTVSGTNTICNGNSTTLTASGGTTYLWSTNATTTSISVIPITNTSYTVTGTNANGCSNTSTVSVTVNPTPTVTVSGAAVICNGDATTLTVSGGTSYLWNTNETTTSISISPTSTTNYSVTGTGANGCSNTIAATVNVNSLPATPTINVNTSTLASSSSTGNQWYLNGNPISGATSQFYNVTQNGFYTVCVTDANGCSSCSAPYNFTTIGITENNIANSISVYPNPNTGTFTLSTKEKEYSITITSILGEKIYSSQINSNKAEIDLSKQPNGIYFLHLKSENGSDSYQEAPRKLIISK